MDRPETGAGVADVDLAGRTALVTGATSGIGREIARGLDGLGATVYVHGRDREAGETLAAELGAEARFFPAEFADLAAVEALAADVGAAAGTLDVLVNDAGAHFARGELTAAGVERTVAVNHLAPFVLTNRLRPRLAADGRVVTVASRVHRRGSISPDLSELETTDDYDALAAYARSKLANVLFTVALARRLSGPTATCCHPGFVPTSGLWREASLPTRLGVGLLARLPRVLVGGFVDTAATAAETPVYLAASPEVSDATGEYFEDCAPARPAATARDETLQERLWTWSEERAGTASADAQT